MTFPTTFPGLYALASLDGAPLAERDADVLGLTGRRESRFLLRSQDDGIEVVDTVDERDGDHALLGHIDEHDALADTLGLDRATSAAMLVRAAIARFGDEAPSRILGEWSFVQWDERRATLTLMVADTLRDAMLFATDGRRVAVAPHIRVLRRLHGIDPVPDMRNLLLHMGHAPLRSTIDDETILRGVRRVRAGTCVTINRGGTTASVRRPLPAPSRWQGSFRDAIDETETVLRRILRAQMTRYPSSAVMLSGGLDSSIIAVLASAEHAGDGPIALTSAAPSGSGLLDETAFSQAVADRAGIGMRPVVPPVDADAYRPSRALSHWIQHPIVSPRHYVYDALYRAASEEGRHAILDGCEGEWTISGYPDGLGWRRRLRDTLSRIATLPRPRSTQDAFGIQLSGSMIAAAERELSSVLRMPEPVQNHGRHDLWGYSPEVAQTLAMTTTTQQPGLRRLLPLRDRRLLTLFACMPYRFITHGGVMRAPGRALLAGRVPDHIRLRRHGRPFSPDYMLRIRSQASPARRRLRTYERSGIGEWLDLKWLDDALTRIDASPDTPLEFVFQAQMTANAAEFLFQWLSVEDHAYDD